MSNSKKEFYEERKKENFYKKAKKTKVRARSYFKLENIDKKFKIVKDNSTILDLGCAPGGWVEYLDNKLKNSKIIGIDILEVKNQHEFSKNVEIIKDDMRNFTNYHKEKVDLVLSDMAPEFSGNSKVDRGRTHQLNFLTLDLCKEDLKDGGNLIFKSFEGEDIEEVRKRAKKMFKIVKDYKPDASQKKSSEVFIVCIRKKKSEMS